MFTQIRKIIFKINGKEVFIPKPPEMIFGYQDSSGEFRPDTRYSCTTVFEHREKIKIGNNVFIGHYTIIDGTGVIEIGEGSQIAAGTIINTHSSHMTIRLYGKEYRNIPEKDKVAIKKSPVKIGKYVFIGVRSTILAGVTIGDGSIVSAGSLVTHDVPPHSIVKGQPAHICGNIDELDPFYLEKYPELIKFYFNQDHELCKSKPYMK
jgi:acetyltransferase-like isoleucine patch superfamily enzyme